MTGPPASAARSAGSSDSIRLVTAATPCSTACHCAGVNLRARPGTGVISWPAASARCRSSPVRKSSPASCAAAIPHSTSPAPNPRSRCLTGPTAASSAPITPSRSYSSVMTARPAFAVSDASGAPADPLTQPAATTYPAHQIGVLSAGLTITWQRSSSQARAAPIGIYRVMSPAYSRNRVRPYAYVPVPDSRCGAGSGRVEAIRALAGPSVRGLPALGGSRPGPRVDTGAG